MTGLLRRGSAASLLALGLCLLCISACSGSDKPASEPSKQETRAPDEPVAASSAPLTLAGIAATKVGNYRLISGSYSLGNATNYRAGNYNTANGSGGTDDYRRGYAVFDLSGVDGTIVSATVRFANSSNAGSAQTFGLYPVSTSNIAGLGGSSSASTLYGDLGDGSAYYSATLASVSADPEPDTTGFTLGGTAVNDLTSARNTSPYLFAVGMTYWEGSTNNRFVFDDTKTGAILYLTVNNRSSGQSCSVNSDCQSNVCAGGYCCTGGCPGTNGTASCAMGTGACSVTCNSGYGDCNGNAGDGCEVNINTSTSHCGACGAACTNTNASGSTCNSGTCSFTCNSGFANCDGVGTNGCEINTNTNTSNCGACGAACTNTNASGSTCSSGSCNFTCNSGYGNCDSLGSNGCETNLNVVSACGTTCGNRTNCDDGNVCTVDGCNSGTCTHPAGNAGTTCRAAVAGGCDVAETCTGSSTSCPADAVRPNGTTCRAATGACDVAETCNGTGNTCPADALVASGTVCRASTGACDVAESCTGSSAACPADGYAAASTVCRSAVTVCDVAESCTGSGPSCPADVLAPSTTTCRAAADVCDIAEKCTGSSTVCPSDVYASSSTLCRASAGTCDVAEYCTGSGAACPTDQFLPSTTMCRNQGGNVCDAVDFCTGTSAACTDSFAAQGTDCAYASGATVIWQSGSANGTVDRNSSSGHWSSTSATEVAAASAPGNWGSNVMKFVTTSSSTSTSDRYYYPRLANSSYNPNGSSDLFEYDVYLDDNVGGIGGLDVKLSSSGTYWRTLGAVDQNNIGFDPASDISGRAYHQWYHRRFAVPSGSTISLVDLAVERDTASVTSTAYYDNVMFTTKRGACDGAGVCRLKDGVSCSGNSDCAGGLCAGNACVTPAPNGTACTANYQCVSSFCTDSVCCNSACGSGSTDCLGCSIATGSTADGLCATAAAGTVCRPLANACDIVETCDGVSSACPADTTL